MLSESIQHNRLGPVNFFVAHEYNYYTRTQIIILLHVKVRVT
jgi:hypothetical protein